MVKAFYKEKARVLEPAPRRTLVYAHGNASSRVEGLSQLALGLRLGFQVIAIDCAGSGQSDGDYVSLGCHEQDDVGGGAGLPRRASGGDEETHKTSLRSPACSSGSASGAASGPWRSGAGPWAP